MHLILLALVIGLFLHDLPELATREPVLVGPWLLAAVLGPKLLLAGGYWLACRWTLTRFTHRQARRAIRRLDGISSLYRGLIVVLYAADLTFGLLLWTRSAVVGELILLDELLVLLPTLGLLIWLWWSYYPIDRRLREASLISRVDAGLPLYPIWSRGEYVLSQLRHQVALILVPLLVVLAWSESVELFAPGVKLFGFDAQPIMLMGGAAVVFLLAPLIIRHVWDTQPLPPGELRDRLVHMCQSHGVGVRDLLLWRTFGGMINAAVMGLVAPLRYILLTDALLDMVPRDQVEAVMAHELAHVTRRHMFWLLIVAVGTLGLLELGFVALLSTAMALLPTAGPDAPMHVAQAGLAWDWNLGWDWLHAPQALPLLSAGGAGISWFFLFGWVSRRIERQADTFAVQHMSTQRAEAMGMAQGQVLIDPLSVQTMVLALQQVADLNHIPTHKPSWRHGSIAWRQDYLRSLVGQPAHAIAIDQQMRWINRGALLALTATLAIYLVIGALHLGQLGV